MANEQYSSALACCYKHFPDNKGAVTGFLNAALASGTFIFAVVSQKIVNPDNLPLPSDKNDPVVAPKVRVLAAIVSV